jgi:NAD+ kinase
MGSTRRPGLVNVLVKHDAAAREEGDRVLAAIKRAGGKAQEVYAAKDARGDLLIVVGDSAFLITAFHELSDAVPVLGVGGAGFGVLTEVTVAQFEGAVKRVLAGDYWIENVDRMSCLVGGVERGVALNEAALLASTPGQFVRHTLWVGDEMIWRDRGDGLIVATPTGSTAYALAAGGPVVLANAGVFSVVPICSSDQNKPLVVSQDGRIRVTDVAAPSGVDLVVDGRERVRVGRHEEVEIVRADRPAPFVRLGPKRVSQILGKLKLERELDPLHKDAPPSAKFLYKLLEYEGAMTQAEMIRESNLSARTVRNALGYLLAEGIVVKEPSLRDARQDVYNLRTRAAK